MVLKSNAGASGLIGGLNRFWQRSYAAEYLGFVLLSLGYAGIQFVEPFHRMFSLDDISKQYPHALVERVTPLQNIIYAGIIPLGLLIVWAAALRPGVHKAHVSILGLLISLILTSFLTDVIKNAVGRPRPDLIDRCKPEKGTPEHKLVTFSVCTETQHHTLHDGWRSFPSGHSSFAFAGLGYLALFLAGQFHILRPRADLLKVLVVLAPLVCAGLVAMSRLADYRHDVYDVTAGSILGMAIAHFSYRRYYRHLKHTKCDAPYPNRADVAIRTILRGRRDEEQQIRSAESFELEDLTEDDEDEARKPLHNETSDRLGDERDHG